MAEKPPRIVPSDSEPQDNHADVTQAVRITVGKNVFDKDIKITPKETEACPPRN